MKTRSALVAALFAAASIVSAGAFAADPAAAPTTEAPAPKVKPHSHMQEKTGIAPPATDAKAAPAADEKASADKKVDKKRHFHPRDGK